MSQILGMIGNVLLRLLDLVGCYKFSEFLFLPFTAQIVLLKNIFIFYRFIDLLNLLLNCMGIMSGYVYFSYCLFSV